MYNIGKRVFATEAEYKLALATRRELIFDCRELGANTFAAIAIHVGISTSRVQIIYANQKRRVMAKSMIALRNI